MIQNYITEIADASCTLRQTAAKTADMLDAMALESKKEYDNISAILEKISKSLNEIGGK